MSVRDQSKTRADEYRDLLELWAAWWNNIGRRHFTHYITPPISRTGEALQCTICVGLDDEMDGERCAACGRRSHPTAPGAS